MLGAAGVLLACAVGAPAAGQEAGPDRDVVPPRVPPAPPVQERRPRVTDELWLDRPGRSPKTVQPATRPVLGAAQVRGLVGRLGDEDAARRHAARVELMSLTRADLPVLRQAVKDNLPLGPAQLYVLRDIVHQVYLSGDVYLSEDDGFMGVRLPSELNPEDKSLLSIERGVAVVSRIPGFCAFRVLQDGDVILTVGGQAVNHPSELIDLVRGVRAGQAIEFEVLRAGAIIKVALTLDRRPLGLERESLEGFTNERLDRAERLWQAEFVPLLAETVG